MNENIYRAYDLRGIYGEELTDNDAYYIGVAFGYHLLNEHNHQAVIGHDNRLSSPSLSEHLIKGITDAGVNVTDIGLTTTPMFSYALEYLQIPSGIMITASHNPSIYNGMKVYLEGKRRIYGEIIQAFKEEVKNIYKKEVVNSSKGTVKQFDIHDAYVAMLKDKIHLGSRQLKVVLDCGNGTASIIAKEVYESIGCQVVPLFCDSDPTFPNHHPDPAVEENMAFLKQKVLVEHADLGVGFDGDADRVGIVDETGHMLYMDMYAIIICRELIPTLSDKKIVIDIKCSKALEDEIVKLGGTPVYSRTGHPYMIKTMKEHNIVFGCELSGHAYFADEYYGFDDGLYSGLRLIRILSNTNKSLTSLLEGVNHYYATPEILVKATDDTKFKMIDEVIAYTKNKEYNILTVDGVRVLFSDGWALVRASNTGPNLTMRFEAISEERLTSITNEFEAIVQQIKDKYSI